MALDITWSRRALKLPPEVREELASRLERLRRFFPEMIPKMTVGITRFYDGLAFQSNSRKVKLWINIHRTRKGEWKFPSYWTMAHEMMHLAQFNNDSIPSGERAIDVFALARLPPELIDDSPSYLVITQEIRDEWSERHSRLAHELAREALKRREQGLRKYASWWEDEFEVRIGSLRNRRGPQSICAE